MRHIHNRLIFILTLATAIVAYSTNTLSTVFAYYDECSGSQYVVLGSQSQVDAFSVFFGASCNTISGSLEISGSDITDLTGLAQIEHVNGQLSITSNNSLTTLDGLSNLISISQGLYIQDNQLLTSLSAFTGLETVGWSLNVYSNPALVSIGEFPQLTQVDNLQISNNNKLETISGFASIERLNGLSIDWNSSLIQIAGFTFLDSIDYLSISGNSKLESIANFDALSSSGSIYIGNNSVLSQVPNFPNLVSIENDLSISSNNSLIQIDGFLSLERIGSLSIGSNSNLESITNFDMLSSSGSIDISYNYALIQVPDFPNLASINGSFILDGNDSVLAYPQFSNIESVNGQLSVSWNSSLNQLSGFENLKSTNGLSLSGNFMLAAVEGFSALKAVNGSLNIYYNDRLESFDGLSAIESVTGDVYVNYNNALLDMLGLRSLNSIGGYLQVYSNSKLRDMHALQRLTSTGGLDIQSNSVLLDLNALLNLEAVDGDLTVIYNENLASCSGLAPALGWPDGAFSHVSGVVTVGDNAVGCNKLTQIMDSVTGPDAPVITDYTASSESVGLGFDLASTSDVLFTIEEHQAVCYASASARGSSTTPVSIPDNGSVSSSVTLSNSGLSNSDFISVDVDINHPLREEVELRLRSPAGTEITLWAYGSASPTPGLITTFPIPTEPSESFAAFNGEDFNGEWTLTVSDNAPSDIGTLNSWSLRVQQNIVSSGAQSPIDITGLTNYEEYSCRVSAVTNLGIGPASNAVLVTPQPAPPGTPDITRTDYGDGELYLYVTVDDGGVPVTSFNASCTDGSNQFQATASASPITVTGLTNEVAYTCTVTATNAVGTGESSVPSLPTTPEEAVYSLPIWLLYEASKTP